MIYQHTCAECSAVFDQKQPDPPAPPSLFSPSCPEQLFLFPRIKKVLKGKHFADVEEVKQNMAEALKGIRIDKFKNCLEQWKKVSIGVLHQIENTLKVTEV